MRCERFRASLAATGVVPAVWLSTTTVAPAGWLLMPTCWEVPCIIVAHAATRAGANTASETSFALRDMVPPGRWEWNWDCGCCAVRRPHRQVDEHGRRMEVAQYA